MYCKYQEKSLPSYTANMFLVATCAHNYNLCVTKSLTNINTKTISYDKCIRSDLPKVINETDKDIMDKIATHSYHGFAFYFKGVTIGKYKQNCQIQNCYACKSHSNWKCSKLFITTYHFFMFISNATFTNTTVFSYKCMYWYISTFGYFHSCTLIFFLSSHLVFKSLFFPFSNDWLWPSVIFSPCCLFVNGC